MALTPLILAPLTVLASRSLAGDASLSGQQRRTAKTNLDKQEAFLAPHRDALAGQPFDGIQGGGLNAAEIAEVERRAVIDVDAAIAFGANRSALRVDQFRSERINARQQESHEQSTLQRDLQIKELQRVEQQRVASVAARATLGDIWSVATAALRAGGVAGSGRASSRMPRRRLGGRL